MESLCSKGKEIETMYAVMFWDNDEKVFKLFETEIEAKEYFAKVVLMGCYLVTFFEQNKESGLFEEVFSE